MRARRAIASVVAGLTIIGFTATAAGSSRSTSSASLTDIPIRFTVHELNRSFLHCAASGRTYEVSGRLVAPAGTVSSAVTLYISGVIFSGMFEFHNDLVPGYDFTREMAKLGHTSVVIDRVGYGKTAPYPRDGRKVCLGSQADTVHQVIHALRDGSYSVLGSSSIRPQRFARVAVAGYSLGAVIAELEDASFTDVNALVELSWSDEGFSDYGTSPQYVLSHCSPGLPKPPDGRTGYFRTLPPRKVPPLLSPAVDPRIVATLAWNEELDPCGQELSGAAWFGGLAYVVRADIRIPVLILHGEYDVLFTGPAWHAQWTGFTGTRDRTLIGVPDGQMLMLDRHVGFTRRLLSAWLTDHRF